MEIKEVQLVVTNGTVSVSNTAHVHVTKSGEEDTIFAWLRKTVFPFEERLVAAVSVVLVHMANAHEFLFWYVEHAA